MMTSELLLIFPVHTTSSHAAHDEHDESEEGSETEANEFPPEETEATHTDSLPYTRAADLGTPGSSFFCLAISG